MASSLLVTGIILKNCQVSVTTAPAEPVRRDNRPWLWRWLVRALLVASWIVACPRPAASQTTVVAPLPSGFPDVVPPEMAPPVAEPPHSMPCPEAFTPIFRLHQTIADTVGDNGEFTSLGGFAPHPEDDGIWFGEGQLLLLEDSHYPGGMQTLAFAGNFGLGRRWLEVPDGDIWGVSVWYDFDHDQPEFIHQASVAGEWLGPLWDMRVNGYFPIGAARDLRTDVTSLTGMDMEAGRRLPGWLGENGVSFYSGFYYYGVDRDLHAFGAQERLEIDLSDVFRVDIRVTTDPVFKTNLSFGLTYSLPATGKCKVCQNDDYWRLVQPVVRNWTFVRAPQP